MEQNPGPELLVHHRQNFVAERSRIHLPRLSSAVPLQYRRQHRPWPRNPGPLRQLLFEDPGHPRLPGFNALLRSDYTGVHRRWVERLRCPLFQIPDESLYPAAEVLALPFQFPDDGVGGAQRFQPRFPNAGFQVKNARHGALPAAPELEMTLVSFENPFAHAPAMSMEGQIDEGIFRPLAIAAQSLCRLRPLQVDRGPSAARGFRLRAIRPFLEPHLRGKV